MPPVREPARAAASPRQGAARESEGHAELQGIACLHFPADRTPCGSHGLSSAAGGPHSIKVSADVEKERPTVRAGASSDGSCDADGGSHRNCHRSSQAGEAEGSMDFEDRSRREGSLRQENAVLREAVEEAERQLATLQQDLSRLQVRPCVRNLYGERLCSVVLLSSIPSIAFVEDA
jgi:hypothetical protein